MTWNRRQFLTHACTFCGLAGIAGMSFVSSERRHDSAGSGPRSGSATNPASTTAEPADNNRGETSNREASGYDREQARAALERAEKLGFVPRDAMYWEKAAGGCVRCTLCPMFCVLRPYERGQCKVRVGLENRIATLVYGRPCSVAIDPIEKKPVFHLWPGSTAFSLATAGCMLGCRYCQNWQISQEYPENLDVIDLAPEQVVASAQQRGCRSIAYTYTEPTVFYEYMLATAKLAKAANIGNVMVSSGYINPEPLAELLPYLTVLKVDLKGFSERFYRTISGGSLAPVLAALEAAAKAKVLIDIVTLVVPTVNDDQATMQAMFNWIHDKLGPNVSLFLSRFHPMYRLRNLPSTPIDLLTQLREKAMASGLRYVYLGNVPGHAGENTYCPKCQAVVIGRDGYQITKNHLKFGACAACGTPIPGRWE